MDKIGVEVQVIYPTLFLVYLTDDAQLDVALSRAYNRFIADACAKAPERLKWVAIMPLSARSLASLEEMKWAKQQGAVGIFFRGMEGNFTLDNPYFSSGLRACGAARSDHLHSHRLRQPPPDAALRCRAQSYLRP